MMNAFVEIVKKKINSKSPKNKGESKKPKKPKKKAVHVESTGPGTVYVGHIPHGFFETEMEKYFSQFGKILKLRLARSRKTGESKGFAYIKFASEDVAKIAAESMNNYLFFEKLLKCEFIPADKLHPNAFLKGKCKYTTTEKNRLRQNQLKTEEALKKSKAKRVKRLKELKSFLKEKEIDFKIKPLIS